MIFMVKSAAQIAVNRKTAAALLMLFIKFIEGFYIIHLTPHSLSNNNHGVKNH